MITRAYKKIECYLYNYEYIDEKIDTLKADISNLEYNQNYYKWIKNKSSPLEDQVIRNINMKQRIYKLQKWKKLITYVLEEYRKTNKLNYYFINLKYFNKELPIKIQEKLNLSIKKQKNMQIEILQHIFFIAIKQELLRKKY